LKLKLAFVPRILTIEQVYKPRKSIRSFGKFSSFSPWRDQFASSAAEARLQSRSPSAASAVNPA
jgi:hypothetical protein